MSKGGYYHGDDYISYRSFSSKKRKVKEVTCPRCGRQTPYQPLCVHCGRRLY